MDMECPSQDSGEWSGQAVWTPQLPVSVDGLLEAASTARSLAQASERSEPFTPVGIAGGRPPLPLDALKRVKTDLVVGGVMSSQYEVEIQVAECSARQAHRQLCKSSDDSRNGIRLRPTLAIIVSPPFLTQKNNTPNSGG